MKKIYLLLFIVFSVCTVTAQTTHRYRFGGGLHELSAKGPVLGAHCAGSYKHESLPAGISKNVYRFEKGCGLAYDDNSKNILSSGSYTIEMYFKLDTISGYKKLIDFDSLSTDAGFYNQSGKLVLYSTFTSADSFLGDNTYNYVVVTRDGTTKRMYVYVNNKVAGTLFDSTGRYAYGTDKVLVFFEDDNGTGGEQTGGSVAMINISDQVMDSNTIKSNYASLANRMSIDNAPGASVAEVYPNPVGDQLHISTTVAADITITDVTGRTTAAFSLSQGKHTVPLQSYQPGIYFVKLSDKAAGANVIYKIVKQ